MKTCGPSAVSEPSSSSSCTGSMLNSCSKPATSSVFGRAVFSWLRRVLTLPAENEANPTTRRPSGERLSSCDFSSSPTTSRVVDGVEVVVRNEKPRKQQRTTSDLAVAASAPSAESAQPRKARSATYVVSSPHAQPQQQQQQQQQRAASHCKPSGPLAVAPATSAGAPAGGAVGRAASLPSSSADAPAAEAKAAAKVDAKTDAKAEQPKADAPKAERPREVVMKNYVIGGLNFEVDARYKIKSIVGKGAYGLVCAAEDLCPSPKTDDSPKATESGAAPEEKKSGGACMVAVKKVIDPFHDHTDCKRLLREIRLLRCLRHPNVLHLTDIMPARSPQPNDWKDVYLVTRLFDTNLHRVIYSGHALTDAHIQYILWQIFRALRYLHAAGVVHRDMKPTNLLLNRDCELALADFGLARHMPHAVRPANADGTPAATERPTHERTGSDGLNGNSAPERSKAKGGQLTKYVVTRWYRAPELLVQNRQYDFKVDMWSTGCILAEVLGAKAIFPGKDSLHQLRLVVELLGLPNDDELATITNAQAVSYIRNLRPKEHAATDPAAAASRFAKLYPHASPLLLDLMARLLQFDPRKRPTADEALAHPYLAAYRDAPEEGLPTPEVEMTFEGDNPSTDELRMLIWGEVQRYHPQLADKDKASGGAAAAKQPVDGQRMTRDA